MNLLEKLMNMFLKDEGEELHKNVILRLMGYGFEITQKEYLKTCKDF